MKRLLFAIRRWRDRRFLHRLERVLKNHKVHASPVFKGYIALAGDVVLLDPASKLSLSEIRLKIEGKPTGVAGSDD